MMETHAYILNVQYTSNAKTRGGQIPHADMISKLWEFPDLEHALYEVDVELLIVGIGLVTM